MESCHLLSTLASPLLCAYRFLLQGTSLTLSNRSLTPAVNSSTAQQVSPNAMDCSPAPPLRHAATEPAPVRSDLAFFQNLASHQPPSLSPTVSPTHVRSQSTTGVPLSRASFSAAPLARPASTVPFLAPPPKSRSSSSRSLGATASYDNVMPTFKVPPMKDGAIAVREKKSSGGCVCFASCSMSTADVEGRRSRSLFDMSWKPLPEGKKPLEGMPVVRPPLMRHDQNSLRGVRSPLLLSASSSGTMCSPYPDRRPISPHLMLWTSTRNHREAAMAQMISSPPISSKLHLFQNLSSVHFPHHASGPWSAWTATHHPPVSLALHPHRHLVGRLCGTPHRPHPPHLARSLDGEDRTTPPQHLDLVDLRSPAASARTMAVLAPASPALTSNSPSKRHARISFDHLHLAEPSPSATLRPTLPSMLLLESYRLALD